MTLDDLLNETGGANELAKRLGVSRAAVYQWRAGVSLPSSKNLIELHRLSGGRLNLESLDA